MSDLLKYSYDMNKLTKFSVFKVPGFTLNVVTCDVILASQNIFDL